MSDTAISDSHAAEPAAEADRLLTIVIDGIRT